MCLPYLQMIAPLLGYNGNYGNMGLLGVCDWNPYGMLYYFSGFLGYLVLGSNAWIFKKIAVTSLISHRPIPIIMGIRRMIMVVVGTESYNFFHWS